MVRPVWQTSHTPTATGYPGSEKHRNTCPPCLIKAGHCIKKAPKNGA
jgi:hypothetical protein